MKKIIKALYTSVIIISIVLISTVITRANKNNSSMIICNDVNFESYTERYNTMIEEGIKVQNERLIQEEIERKKLEEEKKIMEIQSQPQYNTSTFTLTFYTCLPSENGGYTTTAWGEELSYGMVASNVYERGTVINIEGYGQFVVADTGGPNFDNYNRLDVFIPRIEGETDEQYSSRVYSMGIVHVQGYIIN